MKDLRKEFGLSVLKIEDADLLADFLSNAFSPETQQKLKLLEELKVAKRVHAVHRSVNPHLQKLGPSYPAS